MVSKYKLVYVCYSNKGRSIALATYTKDYLKKKGLDVIVDSSGVGSDMIESLRKRGMDLASRNTTRILKSQGLNIQEHRLQYLGEVIRGSNLILVSDELSLAMTRATFPKYKERCMLAKQYAGFSRNLEIFGPYAESRKLKNSEWTEVMGYKHMLREINIISKKIVKKLMKELK